MLDTDFSSSARFFTCLRIPFGCLWGSAPHGGLDAGGRVVGVVSLACVTLAVHLTAGAEMVSVDGMDVEGGRGKGRGAGGRGRGGGREEVGGVEIGREKVRSWGRGGLGGERGRGKVVKAMGGRGGWGRGAEMLGGWGAISKEFLFVSVSAAQEGVSLLEFKTRGLRGESSKVQSAGEVTTLGCDPSSTALEMVGRVEKQKWDQEEEEKEEPEDRDLICSVCCTIRVSLRPPSFSDPWASSVGSRTSLLPLWFGWHLVLSHSALCLVICHSTRSMVSGLFGAFHISLLGKLTD